MSSCSLVLNLLLDTRYMPHYNLATISALSPCSVSVGASKWPFVQPHKARRALLKAISRNIKLPCFFGQRATGLPVWQTRHVGRRAPSPAAVTRWYDQNDPAASSHECYGAGATPLMSFHLLPPERLPRRGRGLLHRATCMEKKGHARTCLAVPQLTLVVRTDTHFS